MFKGLGKWLFKSPEFKVLLIGEGACGKTSLLYRLKLGEFVTTIPTIGFNVETIEYPKGWQWTFWDVGGCDKIQPLLRHYLTPDTLVLFLHDCADPLGQSFPDWLLRFIDDMVDCRTERIWILLNKQDVTTANVAGVRQMYEDRLSSLRHITYKVLDHELSVKTGTGVQEIMDELYATVSGSGGVIRTQSPVKSTIEPIRDVSELSEQDLRALVEKEEKEDSMDAQAFWRSFLDADISSWNHRCHLRAGYTIVLESIQNKDSVFDMADKFFVHLKRLKTAQPDRFRNTEHRTMTIFWLLQLQLAIWNYKTTLKLDQLPSQDDFQQVLLNSPFLRNPKLWALYYTKDYIFSPQAKEHFNPPDIQQFPILKPVPEPVQLVVQEDPSRLLRFAFAIAQHTITSKLRRGQVVKEALASLQTNTIRLRAKDPSVQCYSETQAYFWIQIVHAALKSLEKGREGYDASSEAASEISIMTISPERITFADFSKLFNVTPTTWRDYYSRKVWESVAARMTFVAPDIKPLPNVLGISPQTY